MGDVAQILGIPTGNNNNNNSSSGLNTNNNIDSTTGTSTTVQDNKNNITKPTTIISNRIRQVAKAFNQKKRAINNNNNNCRTTQKIEGLPSIVPTNNPRIFTNRIRQLQKGQNIINKDDNDDDNNDNNNNNNMQDNDNIDTNVQQGDEVVVRGVNENKQSTTNIDATSTAGFNTKQQSPTFGPMKQFNNKVNRKLKTKSSSFQQQQQQQQQQQPARQWIYSPFGSSSRIDGLILYHWVRANVEYPDYPYARFDIHLDPLVYTDEEYNLYLDDKKNIITTSGSNNDTNTNTISSTMTTLLANTTNTNSDSPNNKRRSITPSVSLANVTLQRANSMDNMSVSTSTSIPNSTPGTSSTSIPKQLQQSQQSSSSSSSSSTTNTVQVWTRGETDILIELCKQYELRWAIIHDRWITKVGTYRRIEELQYRYYSVAAILLQYRISKEAVHEIQSITSTIEQIQSQSQTSNTQNQNQIQPNTLNQQQQQQIGLLLQDAAAARVIAFNDPIYQPLINDYGTGTCNKVFDIQYETKRRLYYESLYNRSKHNEHEEYALRKELKDIDTQLRKLKKVGTHVLASAGIVVPSNTNSTNNAFSADIQISGATKNDNTGHDTNMCRSSNNTDSTTNTARQRQAFLPSTGITPVPGIPYLQSGRLLMPPTSTTITSEDSTVSDPLDISTSSGMNNITNTTGTVLSGHGTINSTLLRRMEHILQFQLNVPASDQLVPTKRVCDVYDTIRQDLLSLLTYQKYCIQVEGTIGSKRMQLQKIQQQLFDIQQQQQQQSASAGGTLIAGSTINNSNMAYTIPIPDEEALMGLKPIRPLTPPPPPPAKQLVITTTISTPMITSSVPSDVAASSTGTMATSTTSSASIVPQTGQGQSTPGSSTSNITSFPAHAYQQQPQQQQQHQHQHQQQFISAQHYNPRMAYAPTYNTVSTSYMPATMGDSNTNTSTAKPATKKRKSAAAGSTVPTTYHSAPTNTTGGIHVGVGVPAANKKKKVSNPGSKKAKNTVVIPPPGMSGIANQQATMIRNVPYMKPGQPLPGSGMTTAADGNMMSSGPSGTTTNIPPSLAWAPTNAKKPTTKKTTNAKPIPAGMTTTASVLAAGVANPVAPYQQRNPVLDVSLSTTTMTPSAPGPAPTTISKKVTTTTTTTAATKKPIVKKVAGGPIVTTTSAPATQPLTTMQLATPVQPTSTSLTTTTTTTTTTTISTAASTGSTNQTSISAQPMPILVSTQPVTTQPTGSYTVNSKGSVVTSMPVPNYSTPIVVQVPTQVPPQPPVTTTAVPKGVKTTTATNVQKAIPEKKKTITPKKKTTTSSSTTQGSSSNENP